MVDAVSPFKNLFGSFYPTHYIVALVDEESEARQALSELGRAGFDENDWALVPGEKILRNDETRRSQRNLGQRIAGVFPGEEQAIIQGYLDAAAQGAFAVLVHAPDPSRRDEARTILKKQGAYSMHYFGDRTITDLP